MKEVKIALVQFKPNHLNIEKNLERSFDLIEQNQGADIYLFPELYLSGYLFTSIEEVKKVALRSDNIVFDTIKKYTKDKKIAIIGGYAEDESGRFFNSAFFIAEGEFLLNYRKVHLFNEEKLFFSPSFNGYKVTKYRDINFGIMICFDWIFPEAARTLTLKWANIILHPSNLVLPYCQDAMITRALENRVFIATCNRVGTEKVGKKKLAFTGKSQIVDPSGKRLIQLPSSKETVKIVKIDASLSENKNITNLNNLLQDRRPDQYIM